MILIHCDGTVSPAAQQAGYAYIVRRDEKVLAQDAGVVPREWGTTSNVGEYFAVLAALWKINERRLSLGACDPVVVRSDSQLVIYQLTGSYRVSKPHLQKLHQEVLKACRHLNIRFEWVPREQNEEADALARQALAGEGA